MRPLFCRGGRNRTYAESFGDSCTTTIRHPRVSDLSILAPVYRMKKKVARPSFSLYQIHLRPVDGWLRELTCSRCEDCFSYKSGNISKARVFPSPSFCCAWCNG